MKKAMSDYALLPGFFAAERLDSTRVSDSLLAADINIVLADLRGLRPQPRITILDACYNDDQKPLTIHLEKIKIVQEILEQTSDPVILLYQFRHELAALQKAVPQGKVFDSDLVEPWNAGEVPLLFLHPQSGGHGINLQYGGHTMIIFTSSFSLEQMSQAMARIDRQGQTAPVIFHHLVATETVDELLLEVLDQKADNQTEVLRLIKEYADGKQKPPRR